LFKVNALARPSQHCPVAKAFSVYNKGATSRHKKASERSSFYLEETFTGNHFIFD